MKKVQNIWAELSKTKKAPQRTKLSAKKRNVNLNKVDEAYELYEELRSSFSELSYFVDEVFPELEEKMSDIYMTLDEYFINGEMRYAPETAENLREKLNEIEESASELGIDAQDIFDDFDDARQLQADTEDYIDRAKSDYGSSRIERASNFDIPL